jgi:hypothetical protein
MIPVSGGEGSAQPGPRQRVRKPAKRHNPEQSLRVVWNGRGWIPADLASMKIARDRGLMHDGVENISFMYMPRDGTQWGKIHVLGRLLSEHVEEFHGMSSHAVVKKLQLYSGAACDLQEQEIDLGSLGKHKVHVKVPRSLAFGFMDEGEFMTAYREIGVYIIKTPKYFNQLDSTTQGEIAKLLPREPEA